MTLSLPASSLRQHPAQHPLSRVFHGEMISRGTEIHGSVESISFEGTAALFRESAVALRTMETTAVRQILVFLATLAAWAMTD
jgi:hypothetical protein